MSKKDLSILIGNALDHYDSAIYGFLVPVLAPLFFPDFDPIVQLILGYSVLTTSLITRPVGTFIFGYIARVHGPVVGLSYSLVGVAVTMVGLGFLPTYADLGWGAPLLLIALRMMKGIFSAGETAIAKLYIMEDKPTPQALWASYFYQSSSSVGAIVASGMVTIILFMAYPSAWRFCFWLGGLTALSGYMLRRYEASEPRVLKEVAESSLKVFWAYKADVLRVALATVFGYVTGTIPFVFMNSFVPLVTSVSLESMMVVNTILLSCDGVLIPLIGQFTNKYPARSVMVFASIILSLTTIPLFAFLPGASLAYIIFMRVWIVFWGIVFMCPMNFWFTSLFPKRQQYLLVGMGGTLGAVTLGRSLTPLCLWLWDLTKLAYAPGIYVTLLMGITVLALWRHQRN